MKTLALKATAILVPALILGGMSMLHAWQQRDGILWQVPISGYDPRDLLSGHYLQFRYEWNMAEPFAGEACAGDQCALCADEPATFNPFVTLQPLEQAERQCPSYIAGAVPDNRNFRISGDAEGLTRYYIPENEAQRLDEMLRNQEDGTPQFSMGLRVNDSGRAVITMLYVDGVPLDEWLVSN